MNKNKTTARLLTFFLCMLWVCEAAKETRGFGADLSRMPSYAPFYNMYYENLDGVKVPEIHCQLMENLNSTCYGFGSQTRDVQTSILVPVDVSLQLGKCSELDAVSRVAIIKDAIEAVMTPKSVKDSRLKLALVAISTGSQSIGYDVDCILDTLELYNGEADAVIGSFLFEGRDAMWSAGPTDAYILRERSRILSVAPIVFGGSPSSLGEWHTVVDKSQFNKHRWGKGYEFPYYVLEQRSKMSILRGGEQPCYQESETEAPTCVPLGGWTVWGSTDDTCWSWSDQSASFRKKTREGSVAIMVPSTAVSVGPTPGADIPASGIVAALSIAEALKRATDVSVSVFLFPGEQTGAIGSSRFMQDAHNLPCEQLGLEACLSLAYRDELNFTIVDFSQFAVVMSLDQLAFSGADLFFHVDARADDARNVALQEAKARLREFGAVQASTTRLEHSPVTTYVDWSEQHTVPLSEKVILTLTRYNEHYTNPHVFLPSDISSDKLQPQRIAEAANIAVRLLAPHSTASIDETLLNKLWECMSLNFSCAFLGLGHDVREVPDYSAGPFTGHSARDSERAIAAALDRVGFQTLLSPAISPAFIIENNFAPPWNTNNASAVYIAGPRYQITVASLFPDSNGFRLTTMGSMQAGVWTLTTAVVVSLFAVLLANYCLF